MQSVTVSTLNDQIKHLMETTFLQVAVEGEVSRPTYHGSGHVYFSIKDETSQIKAVMFRGNAVKLKFRLEEGMKVVLFGAVTVYKPRGEYQLNVTHVEAAGVGNLSLAFNQLKERLESQGYFAPETKKAAPAFINHIVLITSATGAALQDMLRLVSKRWPMVKLTLIDVLVQGERAKDQIANALAYADTLGADAIVLSRGGGSIEDLWPFNEEVVAHALFGLQTFTVSAVGHEIDWVITDYVADMRAATPTAAIELLLPDQWEKRQYLDQIGDYFSQKMQAFLAQKSQELRQLDEQYRRHSIEQRFETSKKMLDDMRLRMQQLHAHHLQQQQHNLNQLQQTMMRQGEIVLVQKEQTLLHLQRSLSQLDPKLRDKKGYVQLSSKGKVVDLEEVEAGDEVILATSRFKSRALIQDKETL